MNNEGKRPLARHELWILNCNRERETQNSFDVHLIFLLRRSCESWEFKLFGEAIKIKLHRLRLILQIFGRFGRTGIVIASFINYHLALKRDWNKSNHRIMQWTQMICLKSLHASVQVRKTLMQCFFCDQNWWGLECWADTFMSLMLCYAKPLIMSF